LLALTVWCDVTVYIAEQIAFISELDPSS